MPRPREPDPHSAVVRIRLTTRQLRQLTDKAIAKRQTLSAYARSLLVDERKPRRSKKTAPVDHSTVATSQPLDPAMYEQCRKLGVNLNQIAHRMNAQDIAPPAGLEPLLADIRRLINALSPVP